MDDDRARLAQCFAAVFPALAPGEISAATPASVPEWDSIANVTLLALVEEEFGIAIAPDDLERLTSFEAVLAHLAVRA